MDEIEELHKLLHYEPATGVFTWRVRSNSHVPAGAVAGRTDDYGYRVICVRRHNYKAARLAWVLKTGEWPERSRHVDHINGIRDDNRWCNLREVTLSQSHANYPVSRNNLVGLKGVSKRGNKYRARIKVNGKEVYLGTFDNPYKAATWYYAFAQLAYGTYARAV